MNNRTFRRKVVNAFCRLNPMYYVRSATEVGIKAGKNNLDQYRQSKRYKKDLCLRAKGQYLKG